jgi:hypothetical protein
LISKCSFCGTALGESYVRGHKYFLGKVEVCACFACARKSNDDKIEMLLTKLQKEKDSTNGN